MAAGLGFKTFTTGEVLTAADVNGYLMQGILVFANAAARTSAITSPQEGQYSFLKDTNALEYYDGAAWVGAPVGDITSVTAGTGISGGGSSGAVTITNDMATTITAAGDIVVGTGSGTYDNLPIGTTGQVLTADTTISPYKVKWASASSTPTFVGCFLTKSSAQTLSNQTLTAITFNVEELDTDGFHSTTTNTSRITIPSGKGGKYLIVGQVTFGSNTTGQRFFKIIKNNSGDGHDIEIPTSSVSQVLGLTQTDILDLAAGDYIEIFAGQWSGGNLDVLGDNSGPAKTRFAVTYLGV